MAKKLNQSFKTWFQQIMEKMNNNDNLNNNPTENTEDPLVGEENVVNETENATENAGTGQEDAPKEEGKKKRSRGKRSGSKKIKELEAEVEEQEKEIVGLETERNELKDKYLRLFAEFDNYKRRTAKERVDTLKTASADVLKELLPVLDDFDRAKTAAGEAGLSEGIQLIHEKLVNSLAKKGLKPMESTGEAFDAEFHEAITEFPAPTPELKGKNVDTVEKGYTLNDKIIRYAKVVVGK